jgi:CHAT domain-containing protein/tetratricopeptide (TPR) repeat protein
MHGRSWVAALCLALLAACARHDAIPDGTRVIDETVTLTRGPATDSAARELVVDDGSIVIAFADEQLTDVRLKIAATDSKGKVLASAEVENNLAGTGVEIAALPVPAGAHVTVTLTSAPDWKAAGRVPLRVQLFSAGAESSPEHSALIAAARAWSAATSTDAHTDSPGKAALASMGRAIAQLEVAHGDAALAAEAHLIHANMLQRSQDARDAYAEAQRAAAAFAHLPNPDAHNIARANYIAALALIDISGGSDKGTPTPDAARKLARESLNTLSAPTSALAPVERARAFNALVQVDESMMLADEAFKHLEQARASFEAAGNTAGEFEMRCATASLLVELGEFADAARAFDKLLPQIDQMSSPELRVKTYIAAARAQSFSGRADEGADLMMKTLEVARANHLRRQEATALLGLGYVYQDRSDEMQATAFFEEALKIAREENYVNELVEGLDAAGSVARVNGDYDRALKLHEEAVRLPTSAVLQVRSRFDLAVDIYRTGDIAGSIAMFREALAIDLGDPRSHIYTDGKFVLAQYLAEYDQSTPQDLADALRLNAEARETSIRVRDEWRVIRSWRVAGQIDAHMGQNTKALADYKRTFTMSRDFRKRSASTEARSAMLYDEQMAFRGYLDLVLAGVVKRGANILGEATPAELEAMKLLERARQESFGALRVGTLDAKTSAHVDELLEKMAQKGLRIATLMNGAASDAQTTELHDLQLEMSGLHAELDHLRTSAAAALPLTPNWRPLAPGAAQVSYASSNQHVYALVRSASGTRITVLAPGRREIEAQLTDFSKLDVRTASKEVEAALERISATLMPAGLLPAKSSAVEIVAEGRIASVPFPALRSPTDPQRRLIETHEVAMVTSLFGVDEAPRQKQARPFRFVALASGHGTYRAATEVDPTPQLHAATKEISTAAALFSAQDPAAKIKLFSGADGNAAALRDIWAAGADVVHFATHALADLRQPVASLLVLPATDTNGKATYLTAGQVQGWRGDAELVFLSACESAIGPPQFAVGMPGLQRAFLRAGARGVIATLAPIEDVFAQQFSADFYQRYTHGETAARALSETQRAWLVPDPKLSEADQLRRRITALSHAYFAG